MYLFWILGAETQEHKEKMHRSTEDSRTTGTNAREEVWGFQYLSDQALSLASVQAETEHWHHCRILSSSVTASAATVHHVLTAPTQNSDLRYSWASGGSSAHAPCREIERQSRRPPGGFRCYSRPPLHLAGGDVWWSRWPAGLWSRGSQEHPALVLRGDLGTGTTEQWTRCHECCKTTSASNLSLICNHSEVVRGLESMFER